MSANSMKNYDVFELTFDPISDRLYSQVFIELNGLEAKTV
jgi:hypothetical protein